jgi:hypothetical protein
MSAVPLLAAGFALFLAGVTLIGLYVAYRNLHR